MSFRIVVDQARCQGHAQCWMAAPDLFELDKLGYAHATRDELAEADRDRSLRVVAGCPERAISVIDC